MFKLLAIVRQGVCNSPLTSVPYAAIEEARAAARELYRDDRILRVTIVTTDVPSRFVEWVER